LEGLDALPTISGKF